MKRCPQCGREYDNSMMFCLDDGAELLYGPGGIHGTAAQNADPATVLLHSTQPPHVEPATRVFDQDGIGGRDDSIAVAVLPFANLSRNEDNEYFSDGLAEELLNVLSKVKGLRVAARTSAFVFKGKQVSVKEIGKALDVQAVLEGSVRMAGGHVRVAVQLVDVENGYHLWSETYDRTMDDVFAIQDEIARSVVGEMRSRLLGASSDPNVRENLPEEMAKAIKGRAVDPEAHRLMLLGRHVAARSNEADAINAAQYFLDALEIDPDYASCWAQLGRVLHFACNQGWSALDTDYQKAEEVLQRALNLDPDLAEAHARLGRIRWYRDGDFPGSDQCLKRALDLAPENIDVLIDAAGIARELGQFEKAAAYCRRATSIDPLNPSTWATAAFTSFHARDLKEAEFAARRALELAPQRIFSHASLGVVLMMQGRSDDALAEALLEPEDTVWFPWALTIIHHAAGRSGDSDLELRKLTDKFGVPCAFQIAEAHSMRGEIDEAFEWLERAVDVRDPGRLSAKVSPLLEPLHDDPRWMPLLKKIGFQD